MSEWISVKDRLPPHMKKIKVWIENPYFGSLKIECDAVFLRFKDMEQGEFYDAEEQIHLDYVTKWKPVEETAK